MRHAAKLLVEAGCAKGKLAGFHMHVENPALLARVRGKICLVDSGTDTVALEDSGKDQATQTRSNDGDT
jgi:hypothetical protein